jgi:hypothetical protein
MPRHPSRPSRVLAVVALALAGLLAAGCTLVPSIGERTWGLATTNDLGQSQTISVTDASGLVREVEFDPADADPFGGAVTVPAAVPDALDVTWTAAACDVTTTIRIAASGPGLDVDVSSAMDAAGCDAFGVPRTIRLRLLQPVAAGAVTVSQATE